METVKHFLHNVAKEVGTAVEEYFRILKDIQPNFAYTICGAFENAVAQIRSDSDRDVVEYITNVGRLLVAILPHEYFANVYRPTGSVTRVRSSDPTRNKLFFLSS